MLEAIQSNLVPQKTFYKEPGGGTPHAGQPEPQRRRRQLRIVRESGTRQTERNPVAASHPFDERQRPYH